MWHFRSLVVVDAGLVFSAAQGLDTSSFGPPVPSSPLPLTAWG